MQTRIYIKEALTELNFKDRRSFIRWCRNSGLALLKDNGTKKLYVLRDQFEIAKRNAEGTPLAFSLIVDTKRKYGYHPISKYEEECLSILISKVGNVS